MTRAFVATTAIVLACALASRGADQVTWSHGDTVPSVCTPVGVFVKTGASPAVYICTTSNTWVKIDQGGEGGGGIDAGAILMIKSGSCPSGFVEDTDLNGRMPFGTVAANADIGTTGGTDSITPAGTNSGGAVSAHAGAAVSAHAGAAVADHASHTHTYTDVPNHVHVYASQTATTGSASSYEHGAIDTSSTAAEASISTNNPTGGVATGTTNGPSATLTHSVTQPSNHTVTQPDNHTFTQPTFTGTQFDNRSAFLRVVFCRKT